MKYVLIGCGVLLAVGGVAVVALILFAPTMFRWAMGDRLVGAIAIQQIQVQPESPTSGDRVSLRVVVTFAGTGATPEGGLKLEVTAEKKGDEEPQTAAAVLSRSVGAGSSGVMEGKAIIELGKLPAGTHSFTIAIQPPSQQLVGAIEPPREVQVVVKPKKG